MYPATYKSICRVHDINEAIQFPFNGKEKQADLFLYLIDCYDVLLALYSNTEDIGYEERSSKCVKLYRKLTNYLVMHYDKLKNQIPGRLKGWTDGMFVYSVACLALHISIQPKHLIFNDRIRKFIYKIRSRSHESFNVGLWTFQDLKRTLEIIESRWNEMPWDKIIFDYLHVLECRAASFVTINTSHHILDRKNYRMEIEKNVYQLHPKGVQELMARLMLMRRSAVLRFEWNNRIPPEIQVHYLDQFVQKETRHLTTRKFRDQMQEYILEFMLRPSDEDIGSYSLRGSKVSPYAAMAPHRPLAMMDILSKSCSYSTYEVLCEDIRTQNPMHILMVQSFFMSNYETNFQKFFICFEQDVWKHRHNFETMMVPFIIMRSGRFDVMYKGLIYPTPDGSFYHAILIWSYMIRHECKSVVYGGMNFTKWCETILDKPKVIAAVKTSGSRNYKWKI